MNTTLSVTRDWLTAEFAEPNPHHELAKIAERVIEIPQPDTPRLRIRRTSCQVVVEWVATDEKFQLEISERPYATARWERVGEPVVDLQSTRRTTLPGAAFVRYARLTRVKSNLLPRRATGLIHSARSTARWKKSERSSGSRAAHAVERADLTLLWLVMLAIVFLVAQRLIGIY